MGESRMTEAVMSGALFREIHKNAWLKRLVGPDNKKVGAISKKGDRMWIVFCVHDDSEAFLEGYSNTKVAASHVPDWFVCLNTTLHISPSICPRQQEYEFVITLSQDVIRLTAPTWDSMQDWVDALRAKLYEMRILSPNENVYSRMPEVKPLLLPTRDPTSPLPAPPPVPAILVPGIETVSNGFASSSNISTSNSSRNHNQDENNFIYDDTVLENAAIENQLQNNGPMDSTETSRLLSETDDIDIEVNEELSTEIAVEYNNACQSNSSSAIPFNQNESHLLTSSGARKASVGCKISAHSFSSSSSLPNVTVLTTPSSSLNPVSFSTGSNSLVIVDSSSNNNQSIVSEIDNADEDIRFNEIKVPKEEISIDSEVQLNLKNITSLFVADSSKPVRTELNIGNGPSVRLYQESASDSTSNDVAIASDKPASGNSNITIIQVSNPPHSAIPVTSKHGVFSFNFQSEEEPLDIQPLVINNSYKNSDNVLSLQNNTMDILQSIANDKMENKQILSEATTSQDADRNDISSSSLNSISKSNFEHPTEAGTENASDAEANIFSIRNNITIKNNITSENVAQTTSNANHAHYEKIFLPSTSTSITNVPVNIGTRIPPKSPKFSLLSKQQRSVSHTELQINRNRIHNNSVSVENRRINTQNDNETQSRVANINMSRHKNPQPKCSASAQGNSGEISGAMPVRHILMRGLTELQITRPRHLAELHNKSTTMNSADRTTQQNSAATAVQSRPMNNGEKRRRSLSSSETTRNMSSGRNVPAESQVCSPAVRTHQDHASNANNPVVRLTLREQQVLQLRQEMSHPGGVRLTLRKKDCLGSIALVDALGVVWIAGWKQRQHPMLYNALHIGDHLMSVAGVPVNCASDVTKVIRAATGLYVEFIVRRVPYGRVYAIRKETDGQCLGIIQDSNTATIVDIVPNSLAARHGIPPRAQTCDGLSLTSWVLTEINGRPLNLFFKDNEVRDRLNAVGRDISVLIQPADLIKQLKKQLKSMRGYKDYIVQ